VLSFAGAFLFERSNPHGIIQAAVPILYCGVFSIGIGCTLQVVAQRYALSAHAAIILSLQTVLAAVGGALFLGETMAVREIVGCALMFAGMLLSQFPTEYFGGKKLS
jgi:drug/metabolite transporter (DMT)-like permease